jgi:DNA recombination protein RmuC
MVAMEPIQILVVVILAAVLLIQLYATFFRSRDTHKNERDSIIFQHLEKLRDTMDRRLGENNRSIQESVRSQLSESTKIVREVTEGLTKLGETNRQVIGFADQLKQLQDVLKNPKQRGILGEYYLETVLKNVLPPGMYEMQYLFKNGEIVDAIVRVDKKLVPVDSKFSLDNYNRFINASEAEKPALEKAFVNDLKLRITETAKYIRPEEGTMEFAFMFIPSEGIYYDLLTNTIGGGEDENLIQRAAGKYKVIIVSPTSFLAYLQTVMQGLKALQIEKQAEEIKKRVGELGTHIGKYEDFYKKLGKTLETTVNHYNAGYKELGKIDKDVTRITGSAIGVETLTLDKPQQVEE